MNPADSPRVSAVIPARYASTRLPGKMVAPVAGKPLVLHAYLRAQQAALVDETIIAADDIRIREAAAPFDARVVMTRPDHTCGTDRIAEVAEHLSSEIIVNVQGDEVLIDPATIDAIIQALLDEPEVLMSTARHRIRNVEDIENPNVVKVVCNTRGHALYFSRSPLPHVRGAGDEKTASHWQHIGVYAYRREFLLDFARMAQTPLEKLEKLEQLRALENGYAIAVVDTNYESIGVDTPEDLDNARKRIEGAEGT